LILLLVISSDFFLGKKACPFFLTQECPFDETNFGAMESTQLLPLVLVKGSAQGPLSQI
jgi:hypothetical protein